MVVYNLPTTYKHILDYLEVWFIEVSEFCFKLFFKNIIPKDLT